jgi:hypothetical protein
MNTQIWQRKDAKVLVAQQALLHCARCNNVARRGEDNRIGLARLDVPEHLPLGAAADPPEAKV